jgi:endo-1,3(4)-beta-glucanase
MSVRKYAGIGVIGCIIAIGTYLIVSPTPLPRANLPTRSRSLTMQLAPGLTPPTNKWFSSLVFSTPAQPIFAHPLAFKATQNGLELSYPEVRASSEVVMGAFTRDIGLKFGQAMESRVEAYDDLSITTTFREQQILRASVQMAQGSPTVPIMLTADTAVILDGVTSMTPKGEWYELTTTTNRHYGLRADNALHVDAARHEITAQKQAMLQLFVLPDEGSSPAFLQATTNYIKSSRVSWKTDSQNVSTTFALQTSNNQPTALALLPDQQNDTSAPSLGTYQTILGQQKIYAVHTHTFKQPLASLPTTLRLDALTADQKQLLRQTISQETPHISFSKPDTYFGGKELFRAANLVQLARQLHMDKEASSVAATLKAELLHWFSPTAANERLTQSFYYDETLKGVIGQQTAFGSEDFNDHHFHYGYFIYAAAILAQQDKDFATRARPGVEALINDIANTAPSSAFPRLRAFDTYAGHSWASGFAPFADGNNQESSSEAANAWYGLYLWAQATNQAELSTTAQWLYSREVDFALNYYLTSQPANHPERTGYAHQIVTLIWGGKLDYATFFSPDPAAKLAIQLLPFNPASGYTADNSTRIRQRLDEVGSPQLFKDYILMYRANLDTTAALNDAKNLADADIDGANSRSFMYAWILSRK